MHAPLVECIPNFSDARRPEVIEKIRTSIAKVAQIEILDQHSDLDHNRTVITFIGPPSAVEEAAFQAISTAASLIDLNVQTGEHPRIGATDVVPFVPIKNITMQECVELAKRLGKRVGEALKIPVYLYEEAAATPERRQLENIRRGEYEQLKKEIQTNPDRAPDFGPSELSPAGATVIGARQPLIAYNVYLTTEDIRIAQKIARAVRHSSGGFRHVKAMGVLVEGRAQVSMNLTNFRDTPIHRVIEVIRVEAARYGVAIHHSELVGLIPQEALTDSAAWYLQLDGFEPHQILENRLSHPKPEEDQETRDQRFNFLDDLASSTPTPGGGSAAAFTGSAAASLAAMMGRVTIGKKKYAHVEEAMQSLIEKAEEARHILMQDVDNDAEAFNRYMEAIRMPKETPEQQAARADAIAEATLHAAQVPLDTARHALAAMELALTAGQLGNINALSDAASAVTLARAAITCAGLNVRTNLLGFNPPDQADPIIAETKKIEEKSKELYQKMNATLKERSDLSLPD